MTKYVTKEIDPEQVFISISEDKIVRAAVLENICTKSKCGDPFNKLCRDVYNLEDEKISTVREIVRYAEKGENIKFYILEEVKEDDNDVTG